MMLFFMFVMFTAPSINAWAAPCCSGAVVAPTLITTDSQAQLISRVSGSQVVGRSRTDGSSVFNRKDNNEDTLFLELAGAYALTPRWQVHTSIPASLRGRSISERQESNMGLGDVSAGVAFEAVEELLYNPYKPRVWVYVDITAPTGRSIYDEPSLLGASAHGRGSWSATAGAFALKNWGAFDFSIAAQHSRSLSAQHDVNGRGVRVSPGAVSSLSGSGGYNFNRYRLGLSLAPTWEQATASDLGNATDAADKLWWTVGAQASAQLGDVWSVTLSYSDQTLLGPTYNAPLSRSAALLAVHRFE